MVLPLMPQFISQQDGAEKQNCEGNAAKRWLITHSGRVAELRPVYLGDALFSYTRTPCLTNSRHMRRGSPHRQR